MPSVVLGSNQWIFAYWFSTFIVKASLLASLFLSTKWRSFLLLSLTNLFIMEYVFWNMVANSGADHTICHLGWDRVWQCVVNYFRLSGQESLFVSWYLSRILNRSIQTSKGLRRYSKKGAQQIQRPADTHEQGLNDKANGALIQAQGEKRGAAEYKSDRSKRSGGETGGRN